MKSVSGVQIPEFELDVGSVDGMVKFYREIGLQLF